MFVNAKVRKWGNSLAVVLPRKLVDEEHITSNEEVSIGVNKKLKAKHIFGILPGLKKHGQESKDEMRSGW